MRKFIQEFVMFVNEIKLYKSRKLLIFKNIPITSCFCSSKGAEGGKYPK